MSASALADLLVTLGFLGALVLALKIDARRIDGISRLFLVACLGLYVGVGSSDFLEHAGISNLFEPFEEYAEVLFTPFFLFFLFSLQNKQALDNAHHAQRALRKTEKQFRGIFENAVEGIFQSSLDGRLLLANPAFATMLGYQSPTELLTKNDLHCQQLYVEPEKRREFIDRLKAGPVSGFEVQLHHKDGGVIWAEFNGRLIHDEDGRPPHLEGLAQNITLQKRLESQLIQAQKLEAIGRLSGGIAHDFNNLLTTILGYGEIVLGSIAANDPNRRPLETMVQAGERAASLVRQLLAFSRKQVLEMKPVDLNDVVHDTGKMIGRLIGDDIEIKLVTGARWATVLADRGQIEQVLMNLVVNARDAMPNGGTLTIETAVVDVDANFAQSHKGLEPGPHVILTVTDTGVGMSQGVQEKIFEPFFTTKDKDKGTGLGLATAYGIVQQHHGHIAVYSEPDRGTAFKVYLPITSAVSCETGDPAEHPIPRGSERLLVVDDEPAIRALLVDLLTPLGYRVVTAPNGEAALKLAHNMVEPADLLLTDVVMPGMNGFEVARRISGLWPSVKTVLMSGYTENTLFEDGEAAPGVEFLQKPLVPGQLARRLRLVLDRGGEKTDGNALASGM